MKKVIKNLSIILIFLSFSCGKDQIHIETPTTELSTLAKEVINQKSPEVMRQSYAMLSPQEKESLWKIKYKTILSNDSKKMTSEQVKIVQLLNDFLLKHGIAGLLKNPKIGEDFLKSNISSFSKNFSREQLFMLIECAYFSNNFSVFNSKAYLEQLINNREAEEEVGGEGVVGNCTCYYSISCGSGKTCNSGCTRGPAECGLFGTSNCTGTCS